MKYMFTHSDDASSNNIYDLLSSPQSCNKKQLCNTKHPCHTLKYLIHTMNMTYAIQYSKNKTLLVCTYHILSGTHLVY
jgi:hypothetical protein